MTERRSTLADAIVEVVARHSSRAIASSVLAAALRRAGSTPERLESEGISEGLLAMLRTGIGLYVGQDLQRQACLRELAALRGPRTAAPPPAAASPAPVEVEITTEAHIVEARTAARQMAATLGFNNTTQVKIATAVSELARNIVSYVGRGRVSLAPVVVPRCGLRIIAQDQGPGIPHLDVVLSGTYRSRSGLGLGLLGCQRLASEFSCDTGPGKGTRVTLTMYR